MPTIAAKVVSKPRKEWSCEVCRKVPDRAPSMVMYGSAERGDKPYRMRCCVPCARIFTDPKVVRALAKHEPGPSFMRQLMERVGYDPAKSPKETP